MCMTKDEIERLDKAQKIVKAELIMHHDKFGYWKDRFDNYFFAEMDLNYFPIRRWENSMEVVESVFTEYVSTGVVDYERLEKRWKRKSCLTA